MIKAGQPNQNKQHGIKKQTFASPQTASPISGQTNITILPSSASMVTTLVPKTVTAGVSASPHHFTSPVANQNGVLGHVTPSQSHDDAVPSGLTSEEQQSAIKQTLANTKEKTPMCLINELARFNRITHQYTLVDEQGPAHKKTFFVKLQLGDKESYSASGPSIKKAQHAAAGTALEKTNYKHPPPKPNRSKYQYDEGEGFYEGDEDNSITPTVELNALAMKRGEPAIYKNIENRNPQSMYYPPHNYDFRGIFNQRYHYMRPPRLFYVSLKVGQREFIGEGMSRQMARHNAAKKALDILKALPVPDTQTDVEEIKKDVDSGDDETKSEISIVHEIALRQNLPVSFDVIRESGPPHMKNFVTLCMVGSFRTEAEGNSKKISKKRAAEAMLRELRNLPQPNISIMRPKQKQAVSKKKNRNLIKQIQKADPTYGVGINPISRLIQIQQAQKKKEPVYTLVAERGFPRRREFVMQVQVEDQTCSGVGPNKKLAKRHAAEAMLQQLGYNKPSPQPTKPAIKQQTGETSLTEKKVTFSDSTEDSSQVSGQINGQVNRQKVPGLLILPDSSRVANYTQLKGLSNQYTGGGMMPVNMPVRPEIRLRDVCSRLNIDVKFDEFASSSSPNEFLSRVVFGNHTLHGSGVTPESSRDAVAQAALKHLEESGLIKEDVNMAAGDAHRL